MLKPLVLLFLCPLNSHALFDFMGEESKKAAEGAAYIEAVAQLFNEIDRDSDISQGMSHYSEKSSQLVRGINEYYYLSKDYEKLSKGPDWSSKRLITNIRSTTNFIRRLKMFIIRMAAIGGVEGATAANTFQANVSLNEIQKNQQAQILMEKEHRAHELEFKIEQEKRWEVFLKREKSLRSQNYGK